MIMYEALFLRRTGQAGLHRTPRPRHQCLARLAEQAKALMEAGVATQAEQAQRLARDWMIQLERDTAQDPALLTGLDTMHAAEADCSSEPASARPCATMCWRRSPNTAWRSTGAT